MQKIVIAEGVVMLVEEITHNIVPLEEFRKAISTDKISTPVLPLGTVYYSERGNTTIVAIIRRAEIREMDQANMVSVLATPHRLYTIKLRNGGVSETKQHFMLDLPSNMETPVYQAPYPNRTDDGKLCQSGLMIAAQQESLVFKIDHLVNQVERTRHNTDHISFAKSGMPSNFKPAGHDGQYTHMLQAWAAWTKEHEETWEADLPTIQWQRSGTFGAIVGGSNE